MAVEVDVAQDRSLGSDEQRHQHGLVEDAS
jgi:hypothetical protein